MTEVLSQQEVDALLSAIIPEQSGKQDRGENNGALIGGNEQHVKIYDFKRPDKFSKDQIRTIQMMHETFARLTTTSLSAQLRTLVNVHVISVDQLTYEEFVRSIPSPTTLGVINMEPLKGSGILEIDPNITFAIIDRLFGGTGETTKLNRELTDIEISVMEGIMVRALGNLREAWSNVVDLRPRLGNIETNPQFAQIVPPNDMVVLVTLETKVGTVEGMMDLCVPYLTIEPIISKLSAQYWYSSIRKGITRENFDNLKRNVAKTDVDIIAQLGAMEITIRDLIQLEEGDVLKLSKKKLDDDLDLKVGNVNKFFCRPGIVGKRLAVQIVDTIGSVDVVKDVFSEIAENQQQD